MITKTTFTVDQAVLQEAQNFLSNQDVIVFNEPAQSFFYDPWTIKEEYKNTVWDHLLATLPIGKGEARLIALKPGESYMAHADIDDRWHLNITGNYSFLINLEDNRMYSLKADAIWYEMDAGKIHVASNYGEVVRLQLVVRKLLYRSKSAERSKIRIEPAYSQHDYRYRFDTIISPWLNRLNKYGGLNNFNYKDQIVEFELTTSLLPLLKDIERENFKISYD